MFPKAKTILQKQFFKMKKIIASFIYFSLCCCPLFTFAQNNGTLTANTEENTSKKFQYINLPQTVLQALNKNTEQVFSFPVVDIPGEIMKKKTIDIEERKLNGVSSLLQEANVWKVEFSEGITESELEHFFKTIGY